MTRPTLISSSPIVYSSEALAANIGGLVIAKCTITIDGAVRDCRIVKGLPHLDQAALDVLTAFRYSLAMYRGKPLAVEYIITFENRGPRHRTPGSMKTRWGPKPYRAAGQCAVWITPAHIDPRPSQDAT
jgi:TonB family protein